MTAEGPDGAWGDNVQDDAEAASGNDAVEHDDAAADAADDAADGLSGVAPGTTLAWSGWANRAAAPTSPPEARARCR